MATHDDDKSGDIEKQLLDSPHDQSSPPPPPPPPPTTSTTTVSMEVETVNDKADVKVEESATNPTAASCASKTEDAIISVILYTLLFFFILLMFPLFIVYVLGSICFTGKVIWPDECCSSSEDNVSRVLSNVESKPKGIYKKMQDFESTKEKLHHLNLLTTTRVGCVAFLWLVLNICVPRLTHVAVFGYPLCKWSFLVVIILLGYPLTVICTMLISFIITENHSVKRHNLEYFIKGLERSIASLLHFTLLLLLWLFYFRTDHGLHPSEKVDKFGTWTFVSIVVGAILWVTKSATLLEWKANAVYKRFKGRILTAGFQIYFLSIIINALTFESLLPWRDNNEFIQDLTTATKMESDDNATGEIIDNNCKQSTTKDRKNLRIQDYMLSKVVPIHEIENVARFVTDLAEVTLRENDGIPEIVAKCQEKIPTNDKSTIQYITKETLEEIFGLSKEDAQLLLQELRGEQLCDEITYDAFQKWIVDAHKNCLSVGYTLIDAFAVVSVLNRVIIGFIAVMVILVWLLITKLATTKVLVLIASPFLTFSFVFGDTCKTFFQGIMFSFVTHPYDVGDRCIIDGVELEVKRIAILTTTFVKIGTKERVIYPNASLVTKVITNLEGEPDPSDMVELILDSSTTKSKILSLREDLESFFKSNDQHGYEKKTHVAVKDIGSTIKVSVCFTHVMNVQDVSHSQCLQKKNKQRSELLICIKQFLEDREIKLATS